MYLCFKEGEMKLPNPSFVPSCFLKSQHGSWSTILVHVYFLIITRTRCRYTVNGKTAHLVLHPMTKSTHIIPNKAEVPQLVHLMYA